MPPVLDFIGTSKNGSGTSKVMDYNNEPPKIVYEGNEFQRSARSFQAPAPKIVQLVIKYSGGYIKDEKQANYVLLGFVAVIVVISLFFFLGGGSPSYNEGRIPPMPAAEVGDTNI